MTNPQKTENFDDKMSIDLLIENEEKSQENLKTPQLVKKCENFEEKDKKLNENLKKPYENKTNDFNYENFTNFKNSLEINVISQKSEEFTKEADGSKFFKPILVNFSKTFELFCCYNNKVFCFSIFLRTKFPNL